MRELIACDKTRFFSLEDHDTSIERCTNNPGNRRDTMKFGKSFEQALEEENFPEEWVSASIQYKQLKVRLPFPSLLFVRSGLFLEMYKQGLLGIVWSGD